MCIGNEACGDPLEGAVQALIPFARDCRFQEIFGLTWNPRGYFNQILFVLLAASRDMSLGITSASVCGALASIAWYRWAAIQESENIAGIQQSLITVLEKQLERCGPGNCHCPPARAYCVYQAGA